MNTLPAKNRNGAAVPEKRAAKGRKRPDMIKPTDIIRVKGGVDRLMLVIIILLLCFGSVMVFSASFAFAYAKYRGDSYYFVKRQIVFAIIGLIAMFVLTRIDYRIMRRFTVPVFLGVVILLIFVPIYGSARHQAVRWIEIAGIRFQPSEMMKPMLAMTLASYIARFQDKITNYRNFRESSIYGVFIPMGIIGAICLLIAIEKHFSGTIIMFLIGVTVIFIGGARKFWLALLGGIGAAGVFVAIMFTSYAKTRIDAFIHPTLENAYQTVQGLYAIGSGGLLGVGLGNSRQKHLFVPEPQNDFIFSIIGEELGFVGCVAVILLFAAFVWRGFVIAQHAPDTFSSLACAGIVSKVAIQAVLNIAVVTSLIPNTGITLPFFSYGGTALVILLMEMGVVLSISRYSYQDKS